METQFVVWVLTCCNPSLLTRGRTYSHPEPCLDEMDSEDPLRTRSHLQHHPAGEIKIPKRTKIDTLAIYTNYLHPDRTYSDWDMRAMWDH